MKYIIFVTDPPYGTQNSSTSFSFAKALLLQRFSLKCVFFYFSGVYNANYMLSPAVDEFNIIKSWVVLKKKYKIKLYVCSSAAYRRGVINDQTALELGYSNGNFSSYFEWFSLNELAFLIHSCDRIIQF
ncbi:sulfur transfer complex subunit TusD [Buchnera aphidicola (Cinara tujafilina)]|uniref:Sulfur transfer complex subunit TusD n=1 Tax=Buchnera aphidicola (Cinara tujafilina) TaxID=261317 RepID=F7WZP9_9GAMM|nr:sulfurtransferase complex subunit TusD [Buchnera aphidicola]AEH39925.1 sulfur transfer complex subunit TusD [Buchnera aphidicola (Cinara tujafilina)]